MVKNIPETNQPRNWNYVLLPQNISNEMEGSGLQSLIERCGANLALLKWGRGLDKYWDLILEKAKKRGVLRSTIELAKEELLSKIIFEPDKFYNLRIDEGIIENAGIFKVLTIEEIFKNINRRILK
jgi:hypothetical protein